MKSKIITLLFAIGLLFATQSFAATVTYTGIPATSCSSQFTWGWEATGLTPNTMYYIKFTRVGTGRFIDNFGTHWGSPGLDYTISSQSDGIGNGGGWAYYNSDGGFGVVTFTISIYTDNGFSNLLVTNTGFTTNFLNVVHPTANAITGGTSICMGSPLTLTSHVTAGDGAISGYSWNSTFPAYATVSGTASTTAVGTVAAGTTVVRYTVTDANGCQATSPDYAVSVRSLPTVGTISGTNALCVGNSTTLSPGAVTSFGTPSFVWASSTANVTVVAATGVITGFSAGSSFLSYKVYDANTPSCSAVSADYTVGVTESVAQNVNTGVYYCGSSGMQDAIDAALTGATIMYTKSGSYPGVHFTSNKIFYMGAMPAIIINILGASPALTVSGGAVVTVTGLTFTNPTAFPTVYVDGTVAGTSLTMRSCTVNCAGALAGQACVLVENNGTFDAGTATAAPANYGLNKFIVATAPNAAYFGISTLTGGTATAIGNYWGDQTGPYNATTNSCAIGAKISNSVPFYPWYTNPSLATLFTQPVASSPANLYLCNQVTMVGLTGNIPELGGGCSESWSYVSASPLPGNTGTPSAPGFTAGQFTTDVTGLTPGYAYTFLYTITVGQYVKTSTTVITDYNDLVMPTVSTTPTAYCAATSFALNGSVPVYGNGLWSRGLDPSALADAIGNTATNVTTVTGVPAPSSTGAVPDIYEFFWTVSYTNNTCPAKSALAVITNYNPPIALASATNNTHMCYLGAFTLNGAGTTGDVSLYTWTTTGTGVISSINAQSPTYTPTAADYAAGSVSFTLTTAGYDGCPTTQSLLTVTFDKTAPTISCPPSNTSGTALNLCSEANLGFGAYPAYSTTEQVTANNTVYAASGGAATDLSTMNYFSYIDTKSGTCPTVVSRTWTVKDACGNTSSCMQTIYIKDQTAPTLTLSAYAGTTGTNACMANATTAAPFVAANAIQGYSDNCGGTVTAVLTNSVVTGTNCTWAVNYTFSILDACGNAFTGRNYTNTGGDLTAPTLTGTRYTGLSGVNSCKANAETTAPFNAVNATQGYTDNCGGTVTAVLTGSATTGTDCAWVTTYTFDIKDACDNSFASRQYSNTGSDQTAPTLTGTAYAGIGSLNACKVNAVAAAPFNAANAITGYTDNCGGTVTAVLTATDVTGTDCNWKVTYTFTVKDICNNPLIGQTYSNTGSDQTAPSLTGVAYAGQSNVNVCKASAPAFDQTLAKGGYTDNCGGTVTAVETNTSLTGTDCSWNVLYTFKVVDACNNELTGRTYSNTGGDVSAPSLTGAPYTGPTGVNACKSGAVAASPFNATLAKQGYADNCSGTVTATWTATSAVSGTDCSWSFVYTFSVTDACSNSLTGRTYTVTGGDNTPPYLSTTPYGGTTGTNACKANAAAAVPFNATFAKQGYVDACSGGTVTAVWTATNVAGSDCSWQVGYTFYVIDACGKMFTGQMYTNTGSDQTAPTVTRNPYTRNFNGCGTSSITGPVYSASPIASTYAVFSDANNNGIAIDNCGASIGTVTYQDASPTGTCPISVNRTWTLRDACNNATSCIQVLTITDNVAPYIFPAPQLVVIPGCTVSSIPSPAVFSTTLATAPLGTFAAAPYLGVVIENCAITSEKYIDVQNGSCPIIVSRTWYLSDACGQTATATQTLEIYDLVGPVINTPPANYAVAGCNTSVLTGAFAYSTTPVTLASFGLFNSVYGGTATVCTPGPITYVDAVSGTCPILVSRLWTVKDLCTNVTTTCVQTITIQDIIAPSITTSPAARIIQGCGLTDITNPVYSSSLAASTYAVFNVNNGGVAADACGITSVSYQDAIFTAGPCPAIVVNRTWSLSDACGNTSSRVQSITVHDVIAPVISAFTVTNIEGCDINAVAAAGLPAYNGTATNVSSSAFATSGGVVTEGCGVGVYTYSDVNTGTCPIVVNRTWVLTDLCGNASSAVIQVINVRDTQGPIMVTAPLTRNVVGCTTAAITSPVYSATQTVVAYPVFGSAPNNGVATDACGVGIVTYQDVVAGACPVVTRTWVIRDLCGNPTTVTQTINLLDTEVPSITAPANVGVSCASLVPVVSTSSCTVSDNCTASPMISVTFVSDVITNQTCANKYTLTRTYRATDLCGNTATAAQTITVNDVTKPTITAPTTVTVSCATEVPVAAADYTAFVAIGGAASDVCSPTVPTITCLGDVTVSNGCVNKFTVTRTYQAADACGNTATVAQTIVVNDVTKPLISAPAATTVSCATNVPAGATTYALLTAQGGTSSDNCSAAVPAITFGDAISGQTCTNRYTITRTYTATDLCGNAASSVQVITVNDQTAPTITATPGPVTVGCTSSIPVPNIALVSATDGCGGTVSITWLSDVNSNVLCADRYTVTRTYKAADVCGNFATTSQVITVNDVTAPTVTAPADVTVACASAVPAVNAASVTATDGCGGTVSKTWVSDVTIPGSCPNKFVVKRTYMGTDACGNAATSVQTITVNDVTGPVMTCPADVTVHCAGDVPAVSTAAVTASDACGGTVTKTWVGDVITPGACVNKFSVARTYSVVDACGNTSSCTQIITVNDNINPTITAPVVPVSYCALPGDMFRLITAGLVPTIADNCTATNLLTLNYSATDLIGTTTGVCTYNVGLNGHTFNAGVTTVTYTVRDACGNSASTSFNVNVVVTPNAGPDIELCQQTSVTLVATQVVGNGSWYVNANKTVAMPGAPAVVVGVTPPTPTLVSASQFAATAYGLVPGYQYTFYYKLATPGDPINCPVSDTMTVTNWMQPVTPLAGADQYACAATTATLVANNGVALAYGVGVWSYNYSVPSGAPVPTIVQTGLTAAVSGLTPGYNYIFTWTTKNGNVCENKHDNVSIFDYAPASGVSAGTSQTICPNATSVALNGTASNYVNVSWASSGTGTFSAQNVLNPVYTPTPADTVAGSVQITLTAVSTAPCQPVYSTITLTFNDVTAPVVTCPSGSPVTVNANAQCVYLNTGTGWNASATDNCVVKSLVATLTGVTTGTYTSLNNVTFNKGTTTVTWTARDSKQNIGTCQFVVNVVDVTAPVITCPTGAPFVKSTDNNVCTYTNLGTGLNATATDNCNYTLVYTLSGVTTGTGSSLANVVFAKGLTNVLWTASDLAGNTATCAYTVTVNDNQAPSVTCNQNVSVFTDLDLCTRTNVGTSWDVVATDNCGVTSSVATLTGASTGTYTSLAGVVFAKGSTTVLWTVKDAANNTTTCSFIVTVVDNQLPSITCVSNVTKNTNTNVCTWTNDVVLDPTTGDNCPVVVKAYTLSGATSGTGITLTSVVFNKGVTTVTWIATDASSNTKSCTSTVTVLDVQKPVITCPVNKTVYVSNNGCTVPDNSTGLPTATDNCTLPASITFQHTPAGPYAPGVYSVVWTATDLDNNVSLSCTQTLTVVDSIKPVINCLANGTKLVNVGANCKYVQTGTSWDAGYSDNCAATLTYTLTGVTTGTGATTLNGVSFNLGVTTVTWKAMDLAGNFRTCFFLVSSSDVTAPTLVAPPLKLEYLSNAAGAMCFKTGVAIGTPTTADNCSVLAATNNHPSTTYPLGSTQVLWTVLDGSGNSATGYQTVQIVDTVKPHLIVFPGTITITAPAGVCTMTTPDSLANHSKLGNGVWFDNCVLTDSAIIVPSTLHVGINIVDWKATDGSFNTGHYYQQIIMLDVTGPVITCPAAATFNVTLASCNYTNTGTALNATATDNCGVTSLAYVMTGVTTGTGTSLNNVLFNKGVTTVTWTAKDANLNSSTCSYTVTIADNIAPVIAACPSNQTIQLGSAVCTYTHAGTAWDVTATDNCAGTITYAFAMSGATTSTGTNAIAGKVFNKGVTTVLWTVTDASGNTAVCSFTVTVVDVTAPAITCTTNKTVSVGTAGCYYTNVGTTWNATATDACNVASVAYVLTGATTGTGTSLNNVNFNGGVTTVTWTATDNSGLTSVCSYTVTVLGNTLPVVSCTGDKVVSTNLNCTYKHTGTAWNATGSASCGAVSLQYYVGDFTTGISGTSLNNQSFNLGVNIVTWVATDANSNTSTCSFLVTVVDNTPPSITCQPDFSVNNDNNQCFATISTLPAPTAVDGCGVSSITRVPAGNTFNIGETTVIWTAVDYNSNSVTCVQKVFVVDYQWPVVVCPSVTAQTITTGCNWTGVNLAPTTLTDNCGTPTLQYAVDNAAFVTGNANGFVFTPGTHSVVYKATDAAGHVTTCQFNVTVVEGGIPTVSTIAAQVKNVDAGTCTWAGTALLPTVADNCGTPTLSYAINAGAFVAGNANGYLFPKGITTVTYKVTDGYGNTALGTPFTVTVSDNVKPTMSCLSNQTKTTDLGACTWTAAGTILAPAAVADNCGTTTLAYAITGVTTGSGTGNAVGAFAKGTSTVTYTVTDGSANSTSCSFTVVVTDAEAPNFVAPADQIKTIDAGVCTWTGTSVMTVNPTDNCTPAATMTYAYNAGAFGSVNPAGFAFPLGVTTVTYKATDASSNTKTAVVLVTVTDNIAPTLVVPSVAAQSTSALSCTWTGVGLAPLTLTDNCTLAAIPLAYAINGGAYTNGNANGYAFAKGTTTVTYKAFDANGNFSTANFLVVVNDNTAPTIGCPGNVTQVSGVVLAATVAPTYSDNCGIPTVAYVLTGVTTGSGAGSAAATYNVGVTTVTYTVTDASGNTNVCSFTVTITAPPVNNISGKLLYNNPASTPMNNSTVNLKQGGSVVGTATTATDGSFTFNGLNDGAYTLEASTTKPWGGANSTDALWAVRHFTQMNILYGLQAQSADVNGSNFVNSLDALLIARRFVNMINSFPAGDWAFENPSVALSGANQYVEMKAECYGDVNRSWIPGAKTATTVSLATEGTLYVNSNSDFVMPINTTANLNAGAVSLVVNFPADLFDVTGVKVVGADASDVVYKIEGNEVRMAWYNNNAINVNAEEPVLLLNMKAKDLTHMNSDALVLNGATEIADETGNVQYVNLTMPKLAVAANSFEVNVYPNPFSNKTVFSYTLPEAGNVNVKVYDLVGNEVTMISTNTVLSSGNHTMNFDASSLKQGVYTYRMVVTSASGELVKTGRLVITR
ncbi:MAG: HYR domain-containing protein [Bacteroidota bacterium]